MTREELTKEINNLEKEKAEINKKIDDLTKELNNLISLDPTVKVDIKDIIYDGTKICLLDFDSEEEIAFSKLKEIVRSKNEILIRNIKYLDSSLINKIVSLGKEVDICNEFYINGIQNSYLKSLDNILILDIRNNKQDKIREFKPVKDINPSFWSIKILFGEENTLDEIDNLLNDVIDRFYFSKLILVFKLKNRDYLDRFYDNYNSPLDIDDLFNSYKNLLIDITGEEFNTVEEYKKYILNNSKNTLCTNQYCVLKQTVSKIEEYLLNKEHNGRNIFNYEVYFRLEV